MTTNLFTIAEPAPDAPADIFPEAPPTPATFWTSRPARKRPTNPTHTGRYAVTCRKCGAHWTAQPGTVKNWIELTESLAELHHCAKFDALRPTFGNKRLALALKIKQIMHNPQGSLHRCSDKCRGARGPDCECSCGGMFHGASHAL